MKSFHAFVSRCTEHWLARLVLSTCAFGAVLLASGCEVGPSYHTPPPATAPPLAFSDNGRYGNWMEAEPADVTLHSDWWTLYGDQELNTLEEKIGTANQSLKSAEQAYEQAHAMVRVSHADLFPTVTLEASAERERISSNRPLRPTNAKSYYWDFLVPLNVSWEPDLWGRIRRNIESYQTAAQASSADVADVRLSLHGNLAALYFQLRGIDLQNQILAKTVAAYVDSLKLTQDLFHKGLASDVDVEEAKAQLQSALATQTDLGVQRARYEHSIAVLVGAPASTFHLAQRPLTILPPQIPVGIPSQLLERRPDIAAAERRVASANARIGVAKAAYFPNLVLGGGGGVESDQLSELATTGSSYWNAGPSVNEVLYDAGRRRGQVEFAVAQREQATADYRQSVLVAFQEVEDELAALRILETESGQEQEAATAARNAVRLSTARYTRGLSSYLDVLTNETVALTDERAVAAILTRRIVATVQLSMALGGGWNVTELPKS